ARGQGDERGRELGDERLEAQSLAEGALSPAALAAVYEQAHDEDGLEREHRDAAQHGPLVKGPRGQPLVPNLAPGRQGRLVEPPSLQLAPVEHIRIGPAVVARQRSVAVEYAHGELRGAHALTGEADDAASDDAAAHVGLRRPVDRYTGARGDAANDLGADEVLARGVA